MAGSGYDEFRKTAELHAGEDGQSLNQQWWEAAPMTYRDWEASDRSLPTKQDFEKTNADYLLHNPFLNAWFADQRASGNLAGQKVLEIGCGAGSAACLLAQLGASVTVIDITEQAIGLARSNAEFSGAEVDVQQMDCEQLTFADNSFDFVYSWGVIHHSAHMEAAIDEIARVLAPGGKGLVMVYNRNSVRYLLKGLYWLFCKGAIFAGETMDTVQSHFTDGYFHRHISSYELTQLLATQHLVTTKITKTHMRKKLHRLLPIRIDEFMKRHWGWLLVAEFKQSEAPSAPNAPHAV